MKRSYAGACRGVLRGKRRSVVMLLMLSTLPCVIIAQSHLVEYGADIDWGMGVTQRQLYATASTHTVSGDELRRTSAISLRDALYGRLLGLTALKTGGFAGDYGYGATLNVRGIQTTSENGVLILVDGIKRSIDYLTLDEIESVTVLRDASAVALLGYEGVNGALLVKTRRGESGNSGIQVSYDHKFTFSPRVADFVNARTYAEAINRARINDGLTPMYNGFELNAFAEGSYPYYYPDVDWSGEMFKSTGSEDQLNLSMSGGNDRLRYFTMLDYTDARGLLNGAKQPQYSSQLKFSKANIRTNLDIRLTSSTEMEVNALGSFIETNRPAGLDANGLTELLYRTPPAAFPVLNDPAGDLSGIWGGTPTYGMNNVAAQIQATGFLKSHARLFQGDFTLKQDFSELLSGLSGAVRFGYNNFSEIYEQNITGFSYGYQRYRFNANGQPEELTSYQAGDRTDNLKYSDYINRHDRSSYFSISALYRRSFLPDDDFRATLICRQTSETRDGQYQTFNRLSYMGNFHYDLRGRYLADVVVGFHGSNRSYPRKWSFSPTVSLGYIYGVESSDGLLNFGKLRLSGGIRHIDYVPLEGLWLENYNGGGGDYIFGAGAGQQVWGTFIGYQPTRDFKLETAYKLNLGTDLRIARYIDINLDVYYQYRNNILLSGDGLNSSVVGIPSGYVNWGRVSSYGVELGVNHVRSITKDITYNIGVLLTYGRNEIIRTIENVAYDYLSAVGGRVNQAWGLESVGFFSDESDIAGSARQEFDITRPGDIKYRDQNGDGVINENDVIRLGYDTSIPELNYAINLGLSYRDMGFSVLFQGVGMWTQYLGTVGVWQPLIEGASLSREYYEKSWDISSNPAYPRLTSQSNANNYRGNDIWFRDINFLKLRSCEVYWYLPSGYFAKLGISRCKLFIQGENLLTVSNMSVMDPENIGTSYPALKGITAGVSIKF